jgi:oligopeptide/dipeptide ABC transporter ATP-binding protein
MMPVPALAPSEVLDTPILEGRGLSKHFDSGSLFGRQVRVHAVDGVTLSVRRGETLALVGESGSGKSTLGRLLLRLLPPSAGTVHHEGRDITALPAAALRPLRRELQMIFQDPFASLNPRMTVGQIVAEPLWLHTALSARQRRERAAELLHTVGLPAALAQRYPHEFSGGQRQRIGIARALASSPRLLLGDEPVSALDVSVQAQIINLLEDLKEQFGLTLVIVAHGLAVIRHMSDRVAVMYLGRIVEVAPVDRLFEQPLHPYTQALLAAVPVPSPRLRHERPLLQGDLPSAAAPPPGCHFHTRCPHARPVCAQQVPPTEVLDGGHQVACHRWRDIAGAGAVPVALPSPALARRLALFASRIENPIVPPTHASLPAPLPGEPA